MFIEIFWFLTGLSINMLSFLFQPTVKLSHPGFALFTAEKIAELRGIPVDDVLKACRKNTSRMYGI